MFWSPISRKSKKKNSYHHLKRAFKDQSTPKVMDILSSYGVESVMVPRNMTHLLQPLDLTTNASFKKNKNRAFSEYFTFCIMEALKIDPDRDVTSIEVDLRLSALKPRDAKVMTDLFHHLESHKGKEIIKTGWKAAGITDILQNSRQNNENLIKENPFT